MNRDCFRACLAGLPMAVLLSGCATVSPPLAVSPTVFVGRVRDNLGLPVVDAQVSISRLSVHTGPDGGFRLAARGRGPYVVSVEHPDFAYYSRVLDRSGAVGVFRLTGATRAIADPTQRILLRDTRRSEDCVRVPGAPVRNPPCGLGFQVDIPANTLIDDAGRPPTGDVEVKLATFEIQTESMPAPFVISASESDDTAVAVMRPYGAGSVEVRDVGTGRALNLARGRSARIEIPVHPAATAPPARIPLLRFDRGIQRWLQIGTMNLEGEAYSAEVTQLTTFNADTSASIWGCLLIRFWGYQPNILQNQHAEIHVRGSDMPLVNGAVDIANGASWKGLFIFQTLGTGTWIDFDEHLLYSLESQLYYWGEAYVGNTRVTDNSQTSSIILGTQYPLNPPMPPAPPAANNYRYICTPMNLYWDPNAHRPMFQSWRDVDYLAGPITFNRTVRIIRALEERIDIGSVKPGVEVTVIGAVRGQPWLVVRMQNGEIGLAPREGADLSRTRRPEQLPSRPPDIGARNN